MTQAVKRACDACHRRKVKCDGINPCRNCSQAQLSCTYNAVPQKKGPKGSRAKVISELRETQRATSLAAKVHSRMHGLPCSSSSSSGSAPTPGLLTSDLIKECTTFFFENMYRQLPILARRHIDDQLMHMENQPDLYCMMTSMCAFVLLQPGMSVPSSDQFQLDMMPGANIMSSQILVEETLRVRKGFDYMDAHKINHNVVLTDFFLFACNYAQESHDRAWFYLREATSLIHMAGMNKEDHYMQFDPVESSRQRRLFWLLHATERAYAIDRSRPVTLQATINLPTMGDDPTDPYAHLLESFVTLATLFKHFDEVFMNTWHRIRGNLSGDTIAGLQKQVHDHLQSWVRQDPNFADQYVNKAWLQSTAWQLNNGAAHGDESMAYQHNANMSRSLLMSMASQWPDQGMDLFKSGLIEKLFEVTHTTSQYLSMQPPSSNPFTMGPHEHLSSLLNLVAFSRNNDHRFLAILMTQVGELLWKLVNPMLQNAPENAAMNNIDIFDGFGNAGMAQVPPQMQMSMDTDYDRKFPAEEYDKQYASSMNQTTPDSQGNSQSSTYGQSAPQQQPNQDLSNSFVSSPGIVSPGLEYAPQMSTFASTPMSEMVMSPMGHQQNPLNASQQQAHMPSHNHDSMAQHQQYMPTSHPINNINKFSLQQPQRQNSFHLQGPPQMRTVGDFQGLQGQSSQRQPGMPMGGSMNNEMDFGGLQ